MFLLVLFYFFTCTFLHGFPSDVKDTTPSVYWYTNTNLDENKRIMEPAPDVFDGFYFCCNQFKVESDGTFYFHNTSNLLQNIEYYNGKMDIYLVGSVNETCLEDGTYNDATFSTAKSIALELGIQGYLFDFEPDTSSQTLAQEYVNFLKSFQSYMPNINIGCDISGWGILDYYSLYATANLYIYTSMSSTYYGTNITSNENNVNKELESLPNQSIRVGIGSMTTPTGKWNYNWTNHSLNEFLGYLKSDVNVPRVDIWRADIDYTGYDTDTWFYQQLQIFKQ